jgi:hypothetical protein
MKWDTKEFIQAAILGVSGLIAFTVIAVLVYIIGIGFNIRSLRGGFNAEVLLIWDFPLFFILVAIIKILVGGEIIEATTLFLSKIFGLKILANRKKSEESFK